MNWHAIGSRGKLTCSLPQRRLTPMGAASMITCAFARSTVCNLKLSHEISLPSTSKILLSVLIQREQRYSPSRAATGYLMPQCSSGSPSYACFATPSSNNNFAKTIQSVVGITCLAVLLVGYETVGCFLIIKNYLGSPLI